MPPPLPLILSHVAIAMKTWGGSLDLNSVAVETQWGKNTGREGQVTGKRLCFDFEKLHVGLEEKEEKKNGLI